MTTTPTVWKAVFTVNAGLGDDDQHSPVTIGLADDRFLTVWVDDGNNVDNDYSSDIIGKIYDAQGIPVGGAFQLNQDYFLDLENDAAIAALPDGGFVIVYEDNGLGLDGDASIRFERYNALGTQTAAGTIAAGTSGGVQNTDPSIAVFANGNFVVSYRHHSGGDYDVLARVVNGATNAVGAAFDAGQNSADFDGSPDTAILSNGNIVTVYQETDNDYGIEARINTPGGGGTGTIGVTTDGGESDPHVAALAGGGFVVVWYDPASNGDIRAQIRNNAGGIVTPTFTVKGGANSQNEPDVVALKDGGFFVVWDDDPYAPLHGRRFDATGTGIGPTFVVGNGNSPELGLTDDGRILVTFNSEDNLIYEVILDPREKTIVGDNTAETITSRIDGATVNGNGGNDTLLGQGSVDKLFGGSGADVLRGGGSADTLDGGLSADTMVGGLGNDKYFVHNVGDVVDETGGDGTDLVNSSLSFNLASANVLGAVENLTLTGATAVNGLGNGLDNTIIGNGIGNTLAGGDGNDTLAGGAGADTLTGSAGADALKGQEGNDTLTGGQGNDRFVFDKAPVAANADTITDFANVVGSNNDFFQLDNLVFPALGAPGAMNAALFFAGPAAHDADDRIVYNQANGQLFYDTNGNAAGGASLIATLTNEPTLTAADFQVI